LVFHRYKGFTWTKRRVLNAVLTGCFIALTLKYIVLDNSYFIIDKTILCIAGAALVGKIMLKFLPGGVYQDLHGFMEGFLTIDSQKITIYENEYFFADIKSAEVSASDYSGLYIEGGRYNFGSYSNGIGNYLTLYMNDGKKIRVEFQQIKAGLFKDTVEAIVPDNEIYKFVFIEEY
jgi:hypothetical protein